MVIKLSEVQFCLKSYAWFQNRTSTQCNLVFIRSILKSLVIVTMWLALSGAIYSRIALSFALNRIFFSENGNGTVKQNNQSDLKSICKVESANQKNLDPAVAVTHLHRRQRDPTSQWCLEEIAIKNVNPPPAVHHTNWKFFKVAS